MHKLYAAPSLDPRSSRTALPQYTPGSFHDIPPALPSLQCRSQIDPLPNFWTKENKQKNTIAIHMNFGDWWTRSVAALRVLPSSARVSKIRATEFTPNIVNLRT